MNSQMSETPGERCGRRGLHDLWGATLSLAVELSDPSPSGFLGKLLMQDDGLNH